ncbi:MAG: hypothetical protein QM503_11225 [Bacteroidota bacterium]
MRYLIVIATLIIFLSSCNVSKKIEKQADTSADICESMTYNSMPVDKIATDYYSIDTIFIVDNCLNIWVSYSGGCGNSDFILYYTDRIKESMPPKTTLRLQLTDDDPCRAIVQQKLFYNLSYFEDYAEKNGILFKLAGSEKSILYKK